MTDCGCQIAVEEIAVLEGIILEGPIYKGAVLHIEYCPMHRAAPELYKALNKAREDINWMLNEQKFLNPNVFNYLDRALAKVP